MKFRLWPIVIMATPLLFIAYCTHRDNSLDANFHKIAVGMTREQVIGIMGAPTWEGSCGNKFPIGYPPGCVREFGYAKTLRALDPVYYIISFGRNGGVLEAYLIGSP